MEYNPTRSGTVLVFKEGVTEEQARKALEKLKALLDYTPRINTFDPEWGGPVWYIP